MRRHQIGILTIIKTYVICEPKLGITLNDYIGAITIIIPVTEFHLTKLRNIKVVFTLYNVSCCVLYYYILYKGDVIMVIL